MKTDTSDGRGTSRTVVALGGEGIGPEVVDATCGLPDIAVARVYREGKTLTADQGGKATTKEFARAVLEAYRTR